MNNEDYEDRIHNLMAQAVGLRHTLTAVNLLEEAITLADTHGNIELGYDARKQMIDSACFAGAPDKMIVAFTWCLALCDRDPENYPEARLLWQYKWVLDNCPNFPEISLKQMEEIAEDMSRRYEKAGATLRPVYKIKREIALQCGEFEASREWHEQMKKLKRDWLSDCKACETDSMVGFHHLNGDDAAAVRDAAPILSGRETCGEVPHRTFAALLLPLLKLQRVQEAMNYHEKGYRLISRSTDFLTQFAEHITFLTLTDNLSRAAKTFEKHFPLAWTTPSPAWKFTYYLAGRLLLERLQESERRTLKLRFPADFPVVPEAGDSYTLTQLLDYFGNELEALAIRFDARNGNDYFHRRIAGLQELKKLVMPLPYPKSPRAE